MTEIHIDHHTIQLTNEDKIFFPDDGFTKGDLIAYYTNMAEIMLPYLTHRPLTMHRFPDGIGKEGFYQKEAPAYFPEWIERIAIQLRGNGEQEEVLCQNAASLVYLVDQGCITPICG